jgi:hypothetical protein
MTIDNTENFPFNETKPYAMWLNADVELTL